MCKHRFGPAVKVISHTKHLCRSGLSDLNVARHVFKMMTWALARVTSRTRWVILTYDKRFWRSAKHQYESRNGHAPKPPLVSSARNVIHLRDHPDRRLTVIVLGCRRSGMDGADQLRCAQNRARTLFGTVLEEVPPARRKTKREKKRMRRQAARARHHR